MKKLLVILVMFSNICFAQQFPVGAFRVLWDGEPLHSSITTQANTIFPMYRDAYFNTGVVFNHNTDTTTMKNILDIANAYNINLMVPCVVDYYTSAERFYMDATMSFYFTTITGSRDNNDNGIEKPIGPDNILSDGQSLQSNTPNVSMVSGATINPYMYKYQIYRAAFRLKYQRTSHLRRQLHILQ